MQHKPHTTYTIPETTVCMYVVHGMGGNNLIVSSPECLHDEYVRPNGVRSDVCRHKVCGRRVQARNKGNEL